MKRLYHLTVKIKSSLALEWNIQILVFSSVIATIGWLLWSPFLPLYLKALGASMEQLGFVFSIRLATQVFMGVVSGILADRIGRKKCIVMGNTLGATMYIFCGLATHWSHLVIPLILDGVAGSLIGPGMWAMVAESIPEKKRATAFATIQVFGGVAPIIGPAVGGYIGQIHGYSILCHVGALLTYIAALIRWMYLKETLTPKETTSSTFREASKDAYKGILKRFSVPYRNNRPLKVVLAISCLGSFAWSIAGDYFVVFMEEIIGLSSSEIGYIFSLSNFASMLMTIPAGKLADRFGRRSCIIISHVVSFPLFVGFLFTVNFIQTASVFITSTAIGALGSPAWSALLAEITPQEQRATVMGTITTLSSASSSIGPSVGGYLWANYSPRAPFYVDMLIDLPSIMLFALYVRPHVADKPEPPET